MPAGYTKLKKDEPVDHRSIPSKSELDYVHGFGDTTQRSLDSLLSLLSNLRRPQIDFDEMLQEAADTIWRKLEIDNVGIGLRDPNDGKYRYRAMAGFREDAVEGHKQIA